MRIVTISLVLGSCILIGALLIFSFTTIGLSNPRQVENPLERKILEHTEVEDVKKLTNNYCISYGKNDAPIHVVEFFSFQCPHCVRLFREDFERIRSELIDTGKIYFTFHPVPQDLTTVRGVICLEKLNEQQKQLFVEAIFEEGSPSDDKLMSDLMKAAMNVFQKSTPQLDDEDFIQNHFAFEDIYQFIKRQQVTAVPSVEVNGKFFPVEVPDFAFIKSFTTDY